MNALAHAGLAEAYTELAGFYMDPREAMPKAKRAAETALRLDESLADAHAALGYVRLVYDWDGPGRARALLRALDLNPTLATARLNYAAYLTTQARHDDAIREIRRAVNLDPLSVRTHAFGTLLLLFTRRYDEAIELAQKGLEFEPNASFTLAFQGVAYAEQGRFDEAVENLRASCPARQQPHHPGVAGACACSCGPNAGSPRADPAAWRRLRGIRYFCPYEIGTVYVSLGDLDTAHGCSARAPTNMPTAWRGLAWNPGLMHSARDPRYGGLVREIGLYPHTP